ncbi:NAD(P)-binding domain-containing protein [Phyllobacterium sp. LjRoot231]|uniref:NAD(P)-dependent oxidoreductase n=1 Tax=Phyllobacterium sp. LjRoot231 TaxID=3342289 RepID=UPI003ECD8698
MAHIILTGTGFTPTHFMCLEAAGHSCGHHFAPDRKQLLSALPQADGYILGGDEFLSAELLKEAPRLRIISFVGTGFGNFLDEKAARNQAINIINTPGTNSLSVAEAAVGAAIAGRRNLYALNSSVKAGQAISLWSEDITGSSVGIIGMGNIGTRIARIFRMGFNLPVIYTSRSRKQFVEVELGISYAASEEIASQVDILFLTVPSTQDTYRMINSSFLRACKPNLTIVNPASPSLIDYEAIESALLDGRVRIFVQDGYPSESEDPAIRRLNAMGNDRVVIFPHSFAKTPRTWQRTVDQAVDNIITFFRI